MYKRNDEEGEKEGKKLCNKKRTYKGKRGTEETKQNQTAERRRK